MNLENKMKIWTKIIIVVIAAALTFAGFNLMTSANAVELAKAGKKPVCEVVYDIGGRIQASYHYSVLVVG